MKKIRARSRRNRGEEGFALLLAVFLTTLLLVAAIVAAPAVKNERQREKEQEMIWRGKQYVRAIKLYYRKNGRFPAKLDDLIKPQPGQGGTVRFLRQAYKDPMNKADGAWRLIYVGPAGQLIGSTKPRQMLQMGGGPGGSMLGGAPGTPSAGAPSAGTPSSGFGSTFNSSQNQQGTTGTNQSSFGQSSFSQSSSGQGNSADGNPPAPVDTSNFIGGNIIGVGSKAEKPSIIVYEKATNYHQFEFIWDPSKDALTIGGGASGLGTGTGNGFGQPGGPGQTPGSAFGNQGTSGNQPAQQPQPSQPGNPVSEPNEPPLSNNPQ
jgi:hypothetical protein